MRPILIPNEVITPAHVPADGDEQVESGAADSRLGSLAKRSLLALVAAGTMAAVGTPALAEQMTEAQRQAFLKQCENDPNIAPTLASIRAQLASEDATLKARGQSRMARLTQAGGVMDNCVESKVAEVQIAANRADIAANRADIAATDQRIAANDAANLLIARLDKGGLTSTEKQIIKRQLQELIPRVSPGAAEALRKLVDIL